jgi:DNA-binding winged helix-turn-helix (wHTH) protein/Tol biopolymer transport system component
MPEIRPKSSASRTESEAESAARRAPALPDAPQRLGEFVLDGGRLRLQRGAANVKLTPKAGAVLALLLAQRGITVSRAAFFEAVWPGSFSSDDVLTQVIQELRRAFDDRAREPAWIVTVPKLGYRWEGPAPQPPTGIDASAAESNDATATDAPRSHRGRVATAWIAFAAAALGVGAWWSMDRDALPPAPEPRPLLREPARELDPDLSADARTLAYVTTEGARFEIRVRDLARGSEDVLAASDTATLGAPALAPDARHLAYLARTATACELHRIALDTREDTILARDCPYSLPTSLAWSRDGSSIYYTRAGDDPLPTRRNLAIHRFDLAVGRADRISDAGRWLSVDLHPRLSGDGAWLAFVRDGGGRNRIVLRELAAGTERELDIPGWPYRVAWQGEDLILALHGRNGLELWRADREGRLLALLSREGAAPGLALAASADRIVFERHRADDNLWRFDLADTAAAPLALTRETGSEIAPRVSPDGTRLAYLSDAGGAYELHWRDLATGARHQWSRLEPRVPLDLRWSPDGRRMALIVGTEHGKRIMLLDAGGDAIALPATLAALAPAQLEWDPRSEDLWIAAERDGKRELLRARAPDYAQIETVMDGSIASFALDARGPVLLKPSATHFERVDGSIASPVRPIVRPSDQWAWRDGRVAQLAQRGGGEVALVQVADTDSGAILLEFDAVLPEPPLGRHLDLGAGALWLTRRDRVESDLYEITSEQR